MLHLLRILAQKSDASTIESSRPPHARMFQACTSSLKTCTRSLLTQSTTLLASCIMSITVIACNITNDTIGPAPMSLSRAHATWQEIGFRVRQRAFCSLWRVLVSWRVRNISLYTTLDASPSPVRFATTCAPGNGGFCTTYYSRFYDLHSKAGVAASIPCQVCYHLPPPPMLPSTQATTRVRVVRSSTRCCWTDEGLIQAHAPVEGRNPT